MLVSKDKNEIVQLGMEEVVGVNFQKDQQDPQDENSFVQEDQEQEKSEEIKLIEQPQKEVDAEESTKISISTEKKAESHDLSDITPMVQKIQQAGVLRQHVDISQLQGLLDEAASLDEKLSVLK